VTREPGKIESFEEFGFFGANGTKGFGMATVVRHGYSLKPLYGAKLTQASGDEQAGLASALRNPLRIFDNRRLRNQVKGRVLRGAWPERGIHQSGHRERAEK
jgi:hypothetical protein